MTVQDVVYASEHNVDACQGTQRFAPDLMFRTNCRLEHDEACSRQDGEKHRTHVIALQSLS